MFTKAGNRRELRLVEIHGTRFFVIFNFMPIEVNCEKHYHYWMADCLWSELESLVKHSSQSLAGQTFINCRNVMRIFKNEESANFKIKLSFAPDCGSLKDAMEVDDESADISEIIIKAEVHFKGDRMKLKAALDALQLFNEPENSSAGKVRQPKTPIKKRPFKQLQNYSDDKADSDVVCLSPKPETPSKHRDEEKLKNAEDSQKEVKKYKTGMDDRADTKMTQKRGGRKGGKSKLDKNQMTMTSFFSPKASKGKSILSQEETEKFEEILDRKSESTDSQEDIFADDGHVIAECSPLKKSKKDPIFQPPLTHDSSFDSPQPSTSKGIYHFDSQSESNSQTSMYVKLIQSPVKANTPMRKHSKDEDAVIEENYPDPDDAYFRKCCRKLRKVLDKGDTSVLDRDVIEKLFEAHTDYLMALHNGKVHSLLREEYLKADDYGNSMEYNEGGLLFSYTNLNILTDLVSRKVHGSKEEENKYMNYTMKVLMPELIARIVMSVYQVSKEEALKKIREISIYQSNKIFKF